MSTNGTTKAPSAQDGETNAPGQVVDSTGTSTPAVTALSGTEGPGTPAAADGMSTERRSVCLAKLRSGKLCGQTEPHPTRAGCCKAGHFGFQNDAAVKAWRKDLPELERPGDDGRSIEEFMVDQLSIQVRRLVPFLAARRDALRDFGVLSDQLRRWKEAMVAQEGDGDMRPLQIELTDGANVLTFQTKDGRLIRLPWDQVPNAAIEVLDKILGSMDGEEVGTFEPAPQAPPLPSYAPPSPPVARPTPALSQTSTPQRVAAPAPARPRPLPVPELKPEAPKRTPITPEQSLGFRRLIEDFA